MRDYNAMFKRLPERYRKPNNYKMYYALFGDRAEYYGTIQGIKDSRNIDMAVGESLDLLGSNVGQFRDGEDDDYYRQLIKVRIIVNMSIGDISTINTVLNILTKEIYNGLQEAWPDKYWDYEPSAIVLDMACFAAEIPFDLINLIKAAGVRILFQTRANKFVNYAHYAVIDREKTMYQRIQSEFEKEHSKYYGMANILTVKEISFMFPEVYFIKDDGINVNEAVLVSGERLTWG